MEKSKTLIIMASSRSQGHTRKIVNYLLSKSSAIDLIDLNDYKIGYYDYEFKNASDDFMTLIPKILNYKTLIFATPIYWYTMSAQMKTFFDRLSDLLSVTNKPLGRQLREKKMAVLSCGSDSELFSGFTMPFKQSANYLGMVYLGHTHTYLNDLNVIPAEIKHKLDLLIDRLD